MADTEKHKAAAVKIAATTGTVGSLTARNWFLNQYFPGSPMNLSKSITSLKWQGQVAETIRVNMSGGASLRRLTGELANYTTEEDIASGIREIERMARRIIGGDTEEYAAFQRLTRKTEAEALEMVEAGYPSKLGKAYAKVASAAESLSDEALDRAIENAIEKKALSNAFRLATTEINKAINLGAYTRAQRDEDCLAMQIIISSAGNNCEDCIELSELDNGAGPGVFPMEEVPVTPIHPRCVLPNQRVWWDEKLLCINKSSYRGVVVKIRTASGKKITVTVNHPVLTFNGWTSADKLTKGDKVICCVSGQRPSLCIDPNNNKRPPRIKDIFRTVEKLFQMSAMSVPTTAEDFHGDGRFINGNINIINTNGLLLHDVESVLNERLSKRVLYWIYQLLMRFNTSRMITFFLKRIFLSTSRFVCGICSFLSSFRSIKSFGRKPVGFGISSADNISFSEDFINNDSANAKTLCNKILGLSGKIAFDDIVEISRRNYSGHVYNLQVEPSGIYISNGVFVKNCRCLLLPVYKLPEGADEDFGVDKENYDGEFMQPIPDEVFDSIDE